MTSSDKSDSVCESGSKSDVSGRMAAVSSSWFNSALIYLEEEEFSATGGGFSFDSRSMISACGISAGISISAGRSAIVVVRLSFDKGAPSSSCSTASEVSTLAGSSSLDSRSMATACIMSTGTSISARRSGIVVFGLSSNETSPSSFSSPASAVSNLGRSSAPGSAAYLSFCCSPL